MDTPSVRDVGRVRASDRPTVLPRETTVIRCSAAKPYVTMGKGQIWGGSQFVQGVNQAVPLVGRVVVDEAEAQQAAAVLQAEPFGQFQGVEVAVPGVQFPRREVA